MCHSHLLCVNIKGDTALMAVFQLHTVSTILPPFTCKTSIFNMLLMAY